jgi:hypothetical protein
MSTSHVPHWLQIAITVATLCIAAVLTANSQGNLALPMAVISVLSIVKMLLGVFTESWSTVSDNKAAEAVRKTTAQGGFSELRALAFGLMIGFTGLVGCAWWKSNSSTVTTDVGQIAACIIAQIVGGNQDPASISVSCSNVAVADIVAIIDSLLSDPTVTPTRRAALMSLRAKAAAK